MHEDTTAGHEDTTPVLVVGAGLVGLSTSLFLSWHGVRHLLVERHAGTSIHPRAWGLYPRTLELLDAVGVTDALLTEAAGFAGHTLNGKVESLAGPEISVTRIPEPEDVGDISPVTRILSLSQDRIEPILLRRARELGADVRFGTELRDPVQDADGVTATLRDRETGAERRVRARYLIAADGARGSVREHLGIARQGRGTIRHQISIVFRADLHGPLRGRRFAVCRIANPLVDGVLGHDDTLRRGTLIVTHDPHTDPVTAYTPERCTELVRAAVGVPGLPVTVLSTLPWEMAALVAERYAEGRVFLVGDAAHVIPPVGGYGANTGIQDAHNLAWKLAAVLRGQAGEALLGSYDAERRPVGRATVRQAALRLAARTGKGGGPDDAAVADTLSVMFGYRYRSAAVIADEEEQDGAAPDFADPRTLSGAPGTRVPHLWLGAGDGRTVSTLSLVDRRPLLMAGAKAAEWCDAARAVARRTGIDLDVVRLGDDVTERERSWHDATGVTETGAVLIRPDGFVAWRSTAAQPSPEGVLEDVLNHVLARDES
ncbi:FAD-dependent monooxygenase [Streptomyces sp. NPDC047725]|uniref:FAD-dependent monooxygenase n=1 Tax=Streptomyces sp. NPDC047725 TaxID=3365487 RepID=UPI003720AACE